MRTIINISLPDTLAAEVRREVKRGKYASISEYFRDILRERKKLELLSSLERTRKDFENGKGKVLRSLRDLR